MPQAIERAPAGATHELKELEVYEVSLVDRPANKRDFLVVKRDIPMPVGKQLQDDGSGGLSPTTSTTKEFGDAAKKKFRGALTSASGKLTKLIEGIDDATDEAAAMKSAAGIGASLSKFAPKEESADKDEGTTPAPATPEGAPTVDAVKALAERTSKAAEPDRSAETLKQATRDAKVDKALSTLARAAHTLTTVVSRQKAGGPRQAPAAKAAGENVEPPSAPVWCSDMNSEGIPQDEQFV